ncbi:tyrosine-type recombinase/integrase [Micromonospora zamorensis]|uniref:tyrosine-type recombinase/integrase n=1 Tax=Micromonospora zamorensis TaxID=709883 RepID=UPI0037A02167
MATVSKDPSRKKTPWVVRWYDATGKQCKRGFPRRADADRFRADVEHQLNTGRYVDPVQGRRSFRDHAEAWRLAQPARPNTAARHRSNLDRHIYPALGHRPIASITATEIQAFATSLGKQLKPGSVRTVTSVVRAIFAAAMKDGAIGRNPCEGLRLPVKPSEVIVPLTMEQVDALAAGMPERHRSLVVVAAGLGLRQGEVFGLKKGDVDQAKREIRIERQVQPLAGGGWEECAPKNEFSRRTIPLPKAVQVELTGHARRCPPAPGGWVFSTPDGEPLQRAMFNPGIWARARESAALRFRERAGGLPEGEERAEVLRRADQLAECTMHDLRHFFASVLIAAGLNPKIVAARLGHSDPSLTLKTYVHLWPADDDRTREAVDQVMIGTRY